MNDRELWNMKASRERNVARWLSAALAFTGFMAYAQCNAITDIIGTGLCIAALALFFTEGL